MNTENHTDGDKPPGPSQMKGRSALIWDWLNDCQSILEEWQAQVPLISPRGSKNDIQLCPPDRARPFVQLTISRAVALRFAERAGALPAKFCADFVRRHGPHTGGAYTLGQRWVQLLQRVLTEPSDHLRKRWEPEFGRVPFLGDAIFRPNADEEMFDKEHGSLRVPDGLLIAILGEEGVLNRYPLALHALPHQNAITPELYGSAWGLIPELLVGKGSRENPFIVDSEEEALRIRLWCLLMDWKKAGVRPVGDLRDVVRVSVSSMPVVPPESQVCEWKTSFRTHRMSRQRMSKIEEASIRTIAAFLNADGGTLYIGVNPEGRVVGIGHEWPVLTGPESLEQVQSTVYDVIHHALDPAPIGYLSVAVETAPGGQAYLKIDIRPRPGVTYLRATRYRPGAEDEIFVREGLRSQKLEGKMRDQFIMDRHRQAPLVDI
ncbi:MAG: hypothetical protein Fur0036_18030 [Fimbriimonadaceae bacterium]